MPPLPIIEDVFRVTWNFQPFAGITPRIVQNYLGVGLDVTEFGETFAAQEGEGIFGPMHENFEPFEVDILPLDGSTPTQTVILTSAHNKCQDPSDVSPASAAILSLKTDTRGPQGRGRSYIGPVGEDSMSDGQLESTTTGNLQAAWDDWITNLGTGDPSIILGVASYVHADFNGVTNWTVERTLGTQRRRQNQLRRSGA